MTQYAFFFDQGRCSGCHTCTVACKNWHNLPSGPLKYLKVYEYEKGHFPNVRIHLQWVPCYHCEKPACVENCPTGAIYKEPNFGAVLIDRAECDGCRICYSVCPYGAPVFESDDVEAKAQKCDMCIERLKNNSKPICIMACPTRALDFGKLEDITKMYGTKRELKDLPDSKITEPCIIFKAHAAKRELVPYGGKRVLEVMAKRGPLPAIYTSSSDMIGVAEGMIGRTKLVIKHESAASLMKYTRNDEG